MSTAAAAAIIVASVLFVLFSVVNRICTCKETIESTKAFAEIAKSKDVSLDELMRYFEPK